MPCCQAWSIADRFNRAIVLFLTGASGVLGRALAPQAETAGHELRTRSHRELDLFDPASVAAAVSGSDAILHLASRIPPREQFDRPEAWRENDRLRTDAVRVLVDAALDCGVVTFVLPTVTFVYPAGSPADEDTPVREVAPYLRSALVAERETARFAAAGRHGVVLRFGLLDGPGTGHVDGNRARRPSGCVRDDVARRRRRRGPARRARGAERYLQRLP